MRRLPLLTLALTLVALPACGDDGGSEPPDDTAADTGDETPAETGATTGDETPVVGDPLPVPTDGVVVVLDLDAPGAPLADLAGVNRHGAFGEKTGSTQYDGASLLEAFGATHARLHDIGVDVCPIYQDATATDHAKEPPQVVTTCTASSASGPPHLVWTVNDPWAVDDTSNYDFAETDAILANVASFGAGVYLRLGDSFNGVNDTGDPKSYARVATNIYRHVIGEFGSAAAATQPLHVEVYNEPDGMFWVGTDEDFYELFRETVDGVREAASAAGVDVSVGGAGFVHGVTKGLATEGSLADGFVEAVGPERLDFFSAHYYGDCAAEELSDVVTWMTTLRGQLDERGLADTPLHITEWNIGLGTACGMDYYSASRLQSFVGAALVLMHDPSLQIEAAQYYAGIPTMGLFGTSDGRFIVRPGAWALAAHSQLVGHPRLPAEVCDDGACVASGLDQAESPLLALAARTGDGLRAVVVNDTDAPRPYVLHVAGDGVEAATIETVTPPNEARELDAVTEGGVEVPSPTELEALLAEGATPAEAADVVVGVGTAQVSLTVPAHSVQTVVVTRP